MEVEHTNLSANQFETIVQNLRVKQFNFSSSTLPAQQEIKISSCNQSGHNKKTKRTKAALLNQPLSLKNLILKIILLNTFNAAEFSVAVSSLPLHFEWR